jgi:hypothetical protein
MRTPSPTFTQSLGTLHKETFVLIPGFLLNLKESNPMKEGPGSQPLPRVEGHSLHLWAALLIAAAVVVVVEVAGMLLLQHLQQLQLNTPSRPQEEQLPEQSQDPKPGGSVH